MKKFKLEFIDGKMLVLKADKMVVSETAITFVFEGEVLMVAALRNLKYAGEDRSA